MLKLFEPMTRNPPFPWQERLYKLFEQDEIPSSLDIPTGLGKTSVIPLWLLARAVGAPIPRRLVYVVDRRAVIDQSTQIAEELRSWVLDNPELQQKLGLENGKLPISTLRGQHVDNREWLEDPSATAIIVGTVDLVGSRLLFEGYRCSRKMRSYHAGMLGSDCLFVLDEAHLVPAFERLLDRIVRNGADFAPRPEAKLAQPPPNRLLSLSATGRSHGGTSFGLDDNDLQHPVVSKRLGATKRLTLERLGEKDNFPEIVAERAWQLSEHGALPIRCLVFTNSRQDADKALKHLQKLAGLTRMKKGQLPAADVELLVGGRRIFERTASAKRLEGLGFLAGKSTPNNRPAFLFATSAGEVGIDLDADHMICDLVEWERMIQRLGRVNRRGDGDATVIVFRTSEPKLTKKNEQVVEKWHKLDRPFEYLPHLDDGSYNGSPGALRDLQTRAAEDHLLESVLLDASTTAPLFPLLDRATLESWSMTSLANHTGRPKIAPWLRGWIKDFPQTSVLWRGHLPLVEEDYALNKRARKRFFQAAPPHLSELLDTETKKVMTWIDKQCKALIKEIAKNNTPEEKTEKKLTVGTIVAFILSNDGEAKAWTLQELSERPKNLFRELSGATLIVDARFSGLSEGLLVSGSKEVAAVADTGWPNQGDDGDTPLVPFRVRRTLDGAAVNQNSDSNSEVWRERERFIIERSADGEAKQWLVVEKRDNDSATDDDRSAGRPQLLDEHQAWTATRAEKLATRLDMPAKAKSILVLAARLHDEGKRGKPWQAAFSAPTDGDYAKTLGPVNVHALGGYRHEFGSLPYAENEEEVAKLSADDRDLVLHLIASHHGHARPTISTTGDDNAPPSVLKKREREVALRFVRLEKTWGPWGLAWWESLLRSADAMASRDNDNVKTRKAGDS